MSSMNLKFFIPDIYRPIIFHRRMINVMPVSCFYDVQELLLSLLDWSTRSFRV